MSNSFFQRAASSGVGAAILLVSVSGCATMRGNGLATASGGAEPPTRVEATAEKAAEIATQPVRDLGMVRPDIPPALAAAMANPYQLDLTADCPALLADIVALNQHLGDDFAFKTGEKENKVGNAVAAGGQAIVNSVIPFRGLVRELTGAAGAKRRYDDAVDAGYARRGFLRGILSMKKCPAVDPRS